MTATGEPSLENWSFIPFNSQLPFNTGYNFLEIFLTLLQNHLQYAIHTLIGGPLESPLGDNFWH